MSERQKYTVTAPPAKFASLGQNFSIRLPDERGSFVFSHEKAVNVLELSEGEADGLDRDGYRVIEEKKPAKKAEEK